jgi:DNA-binding SARP family transcriptional activator
MIQLRLLGTISLLGDHGREVSAVLRQPRRVALLAYLATSPGFHRRDTLVALFWPERDTEHARAALSDALYHLRRSLAADLIVSRGDEEVGLADSGFWCDAAAAEAAVEAGRLEEAVALYQGELMPGFHLADAPEFDSWLERVRTRVRQRVAQAAASLAERDEASGHLAEAAHWARTAADLSPYEEGGLRRLMTLLSRMGSRGEAVLEYERFARRLAGDLDLEPSAETAALVESLRERRSGAAGAVAERRARPEPGPIHQPTLPAPHSEPVIPAARGRRPWLLALGLGVAALAGILLSVRAVLPRRTATSPEVIAVLPFAYRGRPDLGYLADGMVNLLSGKLDGAPGVRPVDPRSLLRFAGAASGDLDPDHAAGIARHFGAGLFVLGSITEAGGRLDLSATVYDGGRPRSSFEDTAGEAGIFEAIDRLAGRILAGVQDTPLRLARVANQSTTSLPALKAYLEAERAIRVGRLNAAYERLEQATALDTAFALAWYRLAEMVYGYDGAKAGMFVERAQRHMDRLSGHDRELVVALADLLRGAHTAAYQRYREVVAEHPDDAEAWFMLGQVIQRKGHLLGRPWVDARAAYERVLALDPANASAAWWLAAIAAREGRRRDLDSLTRRVLGLGAEPFIVLSARGQRAIVFGDTAGERAYEAGLGSAKDLWAQMNAGLVTWSTGNLAAGRRLWRLIAAPSRAPAMRLLAHTVLAKLELTGGHRAAAAAELDAAGALNREVALEQRAALALARFPDPLGAELATLRDSLRRWPPPGIRPAEVELPAFPAELHPYIRLYLLGLMNARLGDGAAASRYAAELERPGRATPAGSFAADEADAVRSEVAWMGGRAEEALAELERAQFWVNSSGLEEMGDSPFTTHSHEQFSRAELLHRLGRDTEALAWYRTLASDFLYTAPAELREAEIYQRRGDGASARVHYARFIELWSDCDADLQPQLRQAREALGRLEKPGA